MYAAESNKNGDLLRRAGEEDVATLNVRRRFAVACKKRELTERRVARGVGDALQSMYHECILHSTVQLHTYQPSQQLLGIYQISGSRCQISGRFFYYPVLGFGPRSGRTVERHCISQRTMLLSAQHH